ncbi:armadillo-type protein [Mycena crocata]|nr:armadillo-type protein [Mycena crocata]
MPPLTRQGTLDSVFSWWSDSNTPGATINLHAAASGQTVDEVHYCRSKYVSAATKAMIRQELENGNRGASAFLTSLNSAVVDLLLLPLPVCRSLKAYGPIKSQQDMTLREETIQIYTSYLAWKYVSTATKSVILEAFITRAALPVDGATLVNSASVVNIVVYLLESTDPALREVSCVLLGKLVYQDTVTVARLVVLLRPSFSIHERDDHINVAEAAISALTDISSLNDGAGTVVSAGALDGVGELLQSSSTNIRSQTCRLLERLAHHDSAAEAVQTAGVISKLVALLRDDVDDNQVVITDAIQALGEISRADGGANAVVDAGVIGAIGSLVDSADANVRSATCKMLKKLAHHRAIDTDSMAAAVLPPLVHLLSDGNMGVVVEAMDALDNISSDPYGATAVVNAETLPVIRQLLDSENVSVQSWACKVLGTLGAQGTTAASVLQVGSVPRLVALLGSSCQPGCKTDIVVVGAIHALADISRSPAGANAVVDSEALYEIEKLLQAPSDDIRCWTCHLVGTLGRHMHKKITMALLTVVPMTRLVALLSEENMDVVVDALGGLADISRSQDGANAVLDAGTLEFVRKLCRSTHRGARLIAIELSGRLDVSVAHRTVHYSRRPSDVHSNQLLAQRLILKLDDYCGCTEVWHRGQQRQQYFKLTRTCNPPASDPLVQSPTISEHLSCQFESWVEMPHHMSSDYT